LAPTLYSAHHKRVLTHFRLIALAGTALLAIWASGALAQRPRTEVVRLDPGYGGVCEACDLRGRVLTGARMNGSVFDRTDFSYAVLARIDGTESRFDGAHFDYADLEGGRFVRARFQRARFHGARLANANFSAADLRYSTGLTQRQLDRACGDADTRLPPRLRIRPCG
jgi:uncharacterized protein YjbI with pentapeptide repeats